MIWKKESTEYYVATIGPLFADVMEFNNEYYWEIGFESDDQPRDVVSLETGRAGSLVQAQVEVVQAVNRVLIAIVEDLQAPAPKTVQPVEDSADITRPMRASRPGIPAD